MAARGQIGERAGQLGKGLFRCRKRRIRFRGALVGAGKLYRARLRFGFERAFLGVEASERSVGVGRKRALAFKVGRELLEPAVEFADTLLGARLLALESFPRDDETL